MWRKINGDHLSLTSIVVTGELRPLVNLRMEVNQPPAWVNRPIDATRNAARLKKKKKRLAQGKIIYPCLAARAR